MDFGTWVRSQRRRLQMDINTFAWRAGVDPSTISRIENGRTQASLLTTISVLLALDVTPTKLIAELNDRESRSEDEIPRAGRKGEVLSEEDVDDVRNLYRRDHRICQSLVADLFNKVMMGLEPLNLTRPPDQPRASHENDAGSQSELAAAEVRGFLTESAIQRCEVKYPADIDYREILNVYKVGGVLIQADIAALARALRREHSVLPFPQRRGGRIGGAALERLEAGMMDRISLIDVITLDEQIRDAHLVSMDGLFLGMSWRIARHNGELGITGTLVRGSEAEEQEWSYEQRRLVNVTVTLCRWLQHLNRADLTWLNSVREDISAHLRSLKQADRAA